MKLLHSAPTVEGVVVNGIGSGLIESHGLEDCIDHEIPILKIELMQIEGVEPEQEGGGDSFEDVVVEDGEFALWGSIVVVIEHLIGSQVDSFYTCRAGCICCYLTKLPLVNEVEPTGVSLREAYILVLVLVLVGLGHVGLGRN